MHNLDNQIWISPAEAAHHVKYFGTAKRFNAETNQFEPYVPTPEEVVADGLESPEYLNQFN